MMSVFLVFCLGMVFIFSPFIPAIREALRSTDSEALKITNHILRDPRSSPDLIYWHFAHLLQVEGLEALRAAGDVQEASLLKNGILAAPAGLLAPVAKNIARVFSSETLELANKTTYLSKIISMRSIRIGEKNAVNEIHAKETLWVSAGSKIMWWASGRDIRLEKNLDLTGKIQASRSIQISGKFQFLHLESPVIGTDTPPDLNLLTFAVQSEGPAARQIFKEDCEIKSGDVIHGDLIVKGNLILHAGAQVNGSVKCHQTVVLEAGVRISGNLIARGDIQCQGKNWIGGSILGQKNLKIASNCYFGSENQRITVSANTIRIRGNFQAHGTIKAWTRASVS